MQNFSSRGYPALQTRTPRRTMKTLDKCNGMYHLNGLLLCEGTTLRYREDNEDSDAAAIAETETVLENAVEDSEKIMIGMGTKILIWPDAVSFDTAARKLERLSAAWDQGGNTVTIAPCDTGGKTYTVSQTGTTEPGSPTDGTLFLKQNSSASKWAYVSVLEQYDAKTGKWVEIVLNSVKMTLPGLAAAGFKKGDTITVSHELGAMGKDDKTITSQLKTRLKKNSPEVEEAAEARNAGNDAKRQNLTKQFIREMYRTLGIREGVKEDAAKREQVIDLVTGAINQKAEELYKGGTDGSVYDDLADALDSGRARDVQDEVDRLLMAGKEAKNIKNKITDSVKEEYLAGNDRDREKLEAMLLKLTDSNGKPLYEKKNFEQWGKEAKKKAEQNAGTADEWVGLR